MANTNFKLGHRPFLDGLRGISILAVMSLHSGSVFTYGGFLGVDVFFVISGFLITSLLIEEWNHTKSINLKKFYLRRALRLLPALLVLLIVCSIYAIWFVGEEEKSNLVWKSIFYTLFYFSNWAIAFDMKFFLPLAHTWSLSIEEQFYLIWPIILRSLLAIKLSKKFIITLVLIGIIISSSFRAVFCFFGASEDRLYNGLDTRADSLLIGCLAGLLASWNIIPSFINKHTTLVAIVLIIILGAGVSAHMDILYYGLFTLVAVAVAWIILGYIKLQPKSLKSILEFPLLRWVGLISYGLYLWHFPVLFFPRTDRYFGMSKYTALFFCYGLTFLIATTSFYLLEKPILKLKKRFG